MRETRLALLGLAAGLIVVAGGAATSASRTGRAPGTSAGWSAAARDPLVWMLAAVPAALTVLGLVVGRQQDALARRREDLLRLARTRRDEMERTAAELVLRARALAGSAASVDRATSGTAASARETSATMDGLARTATASALTAETVIGLSRASEHKAGEGLRLAEASQQALLRLADEVHALSQLVAGMEERMREVLAVAADMTRLAERSRWLADEARAAAVEAPVPDRIAVLVEWLELHADEAGSAASRGEAMLGEVYGAMRGAVAAAEAGGVRAGEGAMVIEGAALALRDLAQALADTARAARQIARVAQEQDAGIERAMMAMNAIYLAAEETAASTARVAEEARSLDALADRLRRSARPPLADGRAGAPGSFDSQWLSD